MGANALALARQRRLLRAVHTDSAHTLDDYRGRVKDSSALYKCLDMASTGASNDTCSNATSVWPLLESQPPRRNTRAESCKANAQQQRHCSVQRPGESLDPADWSKLSHQTPAKKECSAWQIALLPPTSTDDA